MDKYSYLNNNDISSIETLYKEYLNNPTNIDESWRIFLRYLNLQEEILKNLHLINLRKS